MQKSIKEGAESRGIRLDVYIKDDKNIVYNVEMQASDSRELPKRSRYYQGMVDLQLLEAGDKSYMKLNKTYIIFICTFDLYGKGRHIYTFENICKEDNSLSMGDEATKIFLNSDSDMDDVGKELRAFLDYVKGIKVTNDDFIDRLEEAVKRAKANKKWRRDYMTMEMLERVKFEEGREEGREEGITILVSTLKDMNVPIQVILEKVQEKFNLSLETAKKYI
ncbi:Rpn family recombination-promoting nuclease/putative transposase [Sporofaciens musculi]|uniref:Rpn family recombination-promoting nuclease/putative transposase n=1 Tax=Sporofaciens musculi TaxID=2681861 RepID=UPI001FCC9EC8|nr:Rpn family recombination-promoting nuclease/putative transposase [Sporofaciens musculi]